MVEPVTQTHLIARRQSLYSCGSRRQSTLTCRWTPDFCAMNSIARGLKIPHREKDIKMAVRAASMMELVWCQQLWGLRWEGELRLDVQNQPKHIVRSRINQSKRERKKRRERGGRVERGADASEAASMWCTKFS